MKIRAQESPDLVRGWVEGSRKMLKLTMLEDLARRGVTRRIWLCLEERFHIQGGPPGTCADSYHLQLLENNFSYLLASR